MAPPPDIAGKNMANPSAHPDGLCHDAEGPGPGRCRRPPEQAPSRPRWPEGKVVTADIGGTATTTQFTDAVIARL